MLTDSASNVRAAQKNTRHIRFHGEFHREFHGARQKVQKGRSELLKIKQRLLLLLLLGSAFEAEQIALSSSCT
jgi:hypothetical protein